MKKDKEWLKEEINKEIENIDYPLRYSTDEYNTRMSMIEVFKRKVDQLDQLELPVIPQFVADWFENLEGNKNYLFRFIMRYPWNEDRDSNGIPDEIIDWIFKTDDNILLTLNLIKNDMDYTVDKEVTKMTDFEKEDKPLTLWIDQLDQLELPVIPQFVASAIEKTKESRKNITILNIFNEVLFSGFYTENVDDWISTNSDLFCQAWFSKEGCTIEEEPLYNVKLGKGYFGGFNELKVTLILNDQPGCMDDVIIYSDKKDALKIAEEIGGKVEDVPDV